MDYIHRWEEKGFKKVRLITMLGICKSKFYDWESKYGKVREKGIKVPRDNWLQDREKEAVKRFHKENPCEGYRRLTYMMMDQDIVCTSPSTVYRVLSQAGYLKRWNTGKSSNKGTGFKQPTRPHEHWHIDVSYLNICGTFYYFVGILDGYSRYMIHWDIRTSMEEKEVTLVLQKAKEKFNDPQVTPRVISDNGGQFISVEFKKFVKLCGMTQVRTSPNYPQSNGKLERFHKTLKSDCIRKKTPISLEDALQTVGYFVDDYNNRRLHSAIGYITPKDKLEGRESIIFATRDKKLEMARNARRLARLEMKSFQTFSHLSQQQRQPHENTAMNINILQASSDLIVGHASS